MPTYLVSVMATPDSSFSDAKHEISEQGNFAYFNEAESFLSLMQ